MSKGRRFETLFNSWRTKCQVTESTGISADFINEACFKGNFHHLYKTHNKHTHTIL